jgi:hypothetical protein
MARKTFTAEQIISKLRKPEVLISQGQTFPVVCKATGVTVGGESSNMEYKIRITAKKRKIVKN